jgi:uncharacterized membrane protein YjjP (DUF1212 family)
MKEIPVVKTGFFRGYFIWLKSSINVGPPPHIPYWVLIGVISFLFLQWFGGGLLDFVFGFLGTSIVLFLLQRIINKSKK